MELGKLIDELYRVEENCYDFIHEEKTNIQDTYFRFEYRLIELEREREIFEQARDVYKELYALELETREDVSDFIYSYACSLLAKDTDNSSEALNCFMLAADFGGLKAKIGYAKALIDGDCGIKSPEEGVEILRKLAKEGVPEGEYALYLLHEQLPEIIDAKEAKEHYLRAAELGYGPAQEEFPADFDLRPYSEQLLDRFKKGDYSVCMKLYNSSEASEEEQINYLSIALENHDPEAEELAASSCKDEGQLSDARDYYLLAAKDGRPENYLRAAELLHLSHHFYEEGPAKSPQKEEFDLYFKAAKAGVAKAMTKVGIAYRDGVYVQKDMAIAAKLWEKAFKGGENFEAPFLLGEMYRLGDGAEEDGAEAVRWYTRASKRGNLHAMLALIDIYEHGAKGVEPNESLANRYRFLSGVGRD